MIGDKKVRVLIGIAVAIIVSALLAKISVGFGGDDASEDVFSGRKTSPKKAKKAKMEKVELNEKLITATLNHLQKEAKQEYKIPGMEWAIVKEPKEDLSEKAEKAEKAVVLAVKEEKDDAGNLIKKIETLAANKERISYYKDGKVEKVENREIDPKTKKANGTSIVTYSSGAKSTQEYKNGILDGKSVVNFANGDKEEAIYVAGNLMGESIYTFANGDREELIYVNGVPNGKAAYIYADGTREDYRYENGQRID